MSRPIAISLSPNTRAEDIVLSVKLLFRPWIWKHGSATANAELWFTDMFKNHTAVSFNSGRSALYAILRAFDIGEGDEVIIQAFTCVAVPNSILWCGAKPMYTDIDTTFNIDPHRLEAHITQKTKAIIVQHTFGIPAQTDAILAIAKKHKILVIEDCAHLLGAQLHGTMSGSKGDGAFFSFGRDKVISSVFGGMAIVRKSHQQAGRRLLALGNSLEYPSLGWIAQQLLHPIAFSIILPLYTIGIGKVLLVILQKLRILSFPVYQIEKRAGRPKYFPSKFPNALAMLALRQLTAIDAFNNRRVRSAALYSKLLKKKKYVVLPPAIKGAIYLRYPILVSQPKFIIDKAKRQGILLGNWYHNVIDPKGSDYRLIGYQPGSCPNAKSLASRILNLPTNISIEEIQRVARLL
jgi:perosamine synthetase